MTRMNHRTRDILDDWTVRRIAGPEVSGSISELVASGIPAAVPGVVHLDLIREGIIRHPDLGDGEAEQVWVGRSDWSFRRRLRFADLPEGGLDDDVVEVVLESIDTVGSVLLGDRPLGEVENQFHPHRFRVRREEIEDGAELKVTLRSPLDELDRRVVEFGDRPINADGEWGVYSYLRKSACSFGWDWGPKCPSLGLPGNVRIESWRDARIESVRPCIITCDEDRAVVEVRTDLRIDPRTAGDGTLRVEVEIESPAGERLTGTIDVDPAGDAVPMVRLEILDPARWWPRGRGDQPLYRLRVGLRRGDSELDGATRRIGLRTTALDTEADSEGSGFRVVVNHEPLFCMGANWIPDGLFPGTASNERIRERIRQAVDAGFNMLRVWGGGIYESDAFYDACDELGIMVWQDFMFACATYPEEAPYPGLVEAEARHQVSRLSSHPSIVLWCGGNENVLAWRNWGWREKMDPETSWGRRYFTDLLPAVCVELDRSRPFLPDSPWSGEVEHDPNDPDHGDRHTWDLKVEDFREHVPRFASEFGHQAPPGRRSIEMAIGEESFASNAPSEMDRFSGRQRGWGGDEQQYDRWLDDWFTPATDLDGRIWRMQLLQARATSIAYEWTRLNQPRCGGALIWQLNDAWTGHSWSLIDVHGRPKPAWWSARAACRPRFSSFSVGESGIELAFANGTREPWSVDSMVRRLSVSGSDIAAARITVEVPADAVVHVPIESGLAIPGDPSSEFLTAEVGNDHVFWFYGKDAWLSMPPPDLEVELDRSADGVELRLIARGLVRDLHVDVARIAFEAEASENLITLLPGQARVIGLRGVENLSLEEIRSRVLQAGVITSANDCSCPARG